MNVFDDITLIYVSYKSDHLIKKNIDTIKLFNTIIVDNSNSQDLSIYINNYKKIKYINTTRNLGYGAANNIGVKNATTPYVLILNPDIFFDINSVQFLYKEFLSYKNSGVAGPSLYSPQGIRRSNSSISYLKKKTYRLTFQKTIFKKLDENLAEGNFSCDYIIGCAMLFKRSFFLDIGGFDTSFFMYFEDNDICDRIKKVKKMVLEIPNSHMNHLQGGSGNLNFFLKSKLSIIHKISEYLYLKKNLNILSLSTFIFKNFFDFFQRFIFNLFTLNFKNSFKNLLRIISIFLFITKLYIFL